jgi:hypothetical protein
VIGHYSKSYFDTAFADDQLRCWSCGGETSNACERERKERNTQSKKKKKKMLSALNWGTRGGKRKKKL